MNFDLPDGSELSESEVARQLYEVLEENGCQSVYISWEARTLDRVRNRTTHGYGDKPRTTKDETRAALHDELFRSAMEHGAAGPSWRGSRNNLEANHGR